METKKTVEMITPFQLITILALLGIAILVGMAARSGSNAWQITAIIIILFIHQGCYVYHGVFSSRSNFFFKSLKGREYFRDQGGVLFRFDDGPHPVYTPQILDILKAEGIRALFAVTGKNAEQYPELVARIHRENHIIANHTYSHPYNIFFLGYKRIQTEIVRTNTIIQMITGETPKYFCVPIGHRNHIIGKAVKELGLISVMWDIKTRDTCETYEKIMMVIGRKLTSSSIIMFHDGILPWSKAERDSTVQALQETIRLLKNRGDISTNPQSGTKR